MNGVQVNIHIFKRFCLNAASKTIQMYFMNFLNPIILSVSNKVFALQEKPEEQKPMIGFKVRGFLVFMCSALYMKCHGLLHW